MTSAADEFAYQCRAHRLPPYEREVRFAAEELRRLWRFDFAFRAYRVAIEIEGLNVMKLGGRLVCTGRHATITGFRQDCEKYASAVLLGWSVLRFEQSQVRDDTALTYTMRVLKARGWKAPA